MADQGWDRRSVRARNREQDRLVREWLRTEVRPFSAWWAKRLREVDIRGADDLRLAPVLDEAEAAGAGGPGNPDLLVLPTEDGFKRHATRADLLAAARELRAGGGAAGRRAVLFRRYKPVHVQEAGVATLVSVAYTRTDLDRLHLAGARLMAVLGLGADDRLVSAVPAGPTVRFWGLYHAALAARMTALHPRGADQDPVRPVARALAQLPATVLAVPVAEALALLGGLADRDVDAPELRTVLTVGPPPPGATRAAIAAAAAALGAGEVRVQAVWAPDSARALWGECRPVSADPAEATYGLHTYPDLEVVGVRDVWTDGPAAPNTPGELELTSLGWRGTALVRFATGAWTAGLVTDVPCPTCARTVPRLAPDAVDGAWQPRVAAADGGRVRVDLRAAPAVLEPALSRLDARDWSLREVDGRLVLGLDLPGGNQPGVTDVALAIGTAVGVVPEVRLGSASAAARPQLGAAGAGPS